MKTKEYFEELFNRVQTTLSENRFDIKNNVFRLPDFHKLDDKTIFKGLCRAIFSIQAVWKDYERSSDKISKLLFDYEINKVAALSDDQIFQIFIGIKEMKIRDRFLKQKIDAFRKNARLFLKLQNNFGSVHNFIEQNLKDKEYLIKKFIEIRSEYKLSKVGLAICSEFFKNIGIDDFKPDLHMNRFFSRLGLINNPDFKTSSKIDSEVRELGIVFANKIGKPASYTDSILWLFCAEGKGEICSANPKCLICHCYTKEPKLCKGWLR